MTCIPSDAGIFIFIYILDTLPCFPGKVVGLYQLYWSFLAHPGLRLSLPVGVVPALFVSRGSAAPVPGFTLPRWLLPRRLGKAGTPPIARQLSFETEVPSCFVYGGFGFREPCKTNQGEKLPLNS